MKARTRRLLVGSCCLGIVTLAASCGSSSSDPTLEESDAGGDVQTDQRTPTVGDESSVSEPDASTKDAAKEDGTAPAEAGGDASGDATADGNGDATTDASQDARGDASTDASKDSSVDASADASKDSTVDATDAATATLIQDVQDGTIVSGSIVTLPKKFVTGIRVSAGGSVTLYIQEPLGVTRAKHVYPRYSGMSVFATAIEAAAHADFASLQVGDCVSATGTTGEFPSGLADVGTTTLSVPTAFAKTAGCGTAPTPTTVEVSEIATDTDPVTASNQPGALAEPYEGVLVKVASVTTPTAASTNRFLVTTQSASTNSLEIDSFLIGSNFSYAANANFASITGVYSQVNRGTGNSLVVYRVTPRSIGDLAQ